MTDVGKSVDLRWSERMTTEPRTLELGWGVRASALTVWYRPTVAFTLTVAFGDELDISGATVTADVVTEGDSETLTATIDDNAATFDVADTHTGPGTITITVDGDKVIYGGIAPVDVATYLATDPAVLTIDGTVQATVSAVSASVVRPSVDGRHTRAVRTSPPQRAGFITVSVTVEGTKTNPNLGNLGEAWCTYQRLDRWVLGQLYVRWRAGWPSPADSTEGLGDLVIGLPVEAEPSPGAILGCGHAAPQFTIIPVVAVPYGDILNPTGTDYRRCRLMLTTGGYDDYAQAGGSPWLWAGAIGSGNGYVQLSLSYPSRT